jgi:hypothetical protein
MAILHHAIAAAAALSPQPPLDVMWTPILSLGVGGRPFEENDNNMTFARMPAEAQVDLNPGEWYWSQTSTGMFVQFTSNASALYLTYTVRSENLTQFSNFPPIGFSGMDLYKRDESDAVWRWVASTFNGLSAAYESGSSLITESPLFAYSDGWPVG